MEDEHGIDDAFYNNLPFHHPMLVCCCGWSSDDEEVCETWAKAGKAFDDHLEENEE